VKLPRHRVSWHALSRFCHRVRCDLLPINTDERVTAATLALWEAMDAGVESTRTPEWHPHASIAGWCIDCGEYAFLLKCDNERPGKRVVTTVVLRPKEWRPGDGPRRIKR
jgi:hypothetical protein